ncbi:uroporphyrinogen-III synthase [Brachybacterium sp. UMB0905]|uniref:uroporphyrinogen-III synthase n=1 Tax=Brachybacterium sp. UMB0905 TaxID=2069310 RepID=UPI000C8040F6|nr:uroporphyrinogen-III synthase [Brachybacterium sp. UMB0905]PMC76903.1 uroporphyrinogen-III synthase [Brachybacterium sp. UMB0905]
MVSPSAAAALPVLVTRPAGRAGGLLTLLAARGVTAEHVPLLELVPGDAAQLARAREGLAAGAFTHLVVTSRTTVEVLTGADGQLDVDGGTQVLAVGAGTAAALRSAGIRPHRVAAGSGASLIEQLPPAPETSRVLLPVSTAAAPTVPDGLRAAGYQVQRIDAYCPVPAAVEPAMRERLRGGGYGAVVLTSSQAARRLAELDPDPLTPLVTIGSPTSSAVREAGLVVAAQASAPTDAALADAVCAVLSPTTKESS